jgi:hypothetical protein
MSCYPAVQKITVGRADFVVVDAVLRNRSPRANSLFIREIARYLLILEQLEDRRAAEKHEKTPTLEWSCSERNSEFISTIQGNLRGEQGTCSRLGSDGGGQSQEARPASRFWRESD